MTPYHNGKFQTNLDAFESFSRKILGNPGAVPPFEHARIAMYRGKILDLMWFDGEFPDSPDQEFIYSMNEDWPNPLLLPYSLSGIFGLNLSAMKFVCHRIKRPAWVDLPETFHNRWTYIEFMKMWPFFW